MLPIFTKEKMKLNPQSWPKKKSPSKPWCQKDVKTPKRCKKYVKLFSIIIIEAKKMKKN